MSFYKRAGTPASFNPFLLILPLSILMILSGCAQYDNEVGGSLVDNEVTGELKDTLFQVDRVAMMTRGDLVKLNAANIPLGIQEELTSDIVLRFTEFNALGDTILEWRSGTLKLFGNGFVDSSETFDPASWSAVVYRIDESWDPIELTNEDTLMMTPLDTIEFITSDPFDSVEVSIDTLTLKSWVEDTLAYRIRISPLPGAGFLKNFASRLASNAEKLPVLKIDATFRKGEETYTDSVVTIYSDVSSFLTSDSFQVAGDRLYVGAGYSRLMLFHTDFSTLLSNTVSLNKVEVFVHTDSTAVGMLGETNIFTVAQIRYGWSNSDPDTTTIGSSSSRLFNVSEDTSLVRLDITPLARLWVAEPDSNYGVAVRSFNEFTTIGRRAFYDNSADSLLRPVFRVVYTEFDIP